MEFDENIAKLHGTLCTLGIQEMLNKPGSLHYVVAAVGKIMCGLAESDKSKLAFFMVLNTRLSVSEKLKNDDFVGLFTNITPHIEKDYLIIYVYHLNLQLQLFEVIENCPDALGVELLEVIIKKLKEADFHRDEFGIDHLYQLWQSVFLKICKIDKGLHVNYCLDKFLSSFQDIYDLIQEVLITSMKVQGLEVFVASHLNNFFKTILCFFKSFKAPTLPESPIYKLKLTFQIDSNKCNIENPVNFCIKMIFDELFNILENITVDMWLTFSECFFDSNSQDSAQMLIGVLVQDVLDEVKQFDVPLKVLSCLSSFAINKSDLIAQAEIDEIISNVKENKREWFEALIKHSGFLEQKNSIECLISHLHLASAAELSVILNTSYEYLCTCEDGENLDLTKELFIAAIKKTPDCSEWLEKVSKEYRPNLLTTKHTNDEIIKAFNKISKDKNLSECDMIWLCMQAPVETIKRICHIGVSGSQQIELVSEILKPLKPACSMWLKDFTLLDYILLDFVQEDLNERESQLLVNLIVHLGKQNFLGPSFFNNLLKTLKGYLENESFHKALLTLEIVKEVMEMKLFRVVEAAFLVFMSQVLEHLTWDLKGFSNTKAEGRDLAGRIVALTINELTGKENGSDSKWARQEILKTWEGNQANFCGLLSRGQVGSGKFTSFILALAHSQDKAVDGFRKFLVDVGRPSQMGASVVLSLFVLLPVLSFREWDLIFVRLVMVLEDSNSGKSDVILDLFGSTVHLLTLNLKQEDDMYPCYEYCVRNFVRLAKRCCPKMDDTSLVRTFERITQFLRLIDDGEKRKSCWEICSPLLTELIGLLKKQNAMEAHRDRINELTRLVDVKNASGAVGKLLD